MDNHRMSGLNDPQNSTDVVNKQFVENQLSHYVKTDGTSLMVSPLDMDDNRITGLSLHPVTGDEAIRDGPLERLWGGGGEREFSSRRNFFSSSNSLYELFLGHSMNIFCD